MPKKVIKSKMKQKQKQSQKVIVNISNPKTIRRASSEPTKKYLPLMPSFNINASQPQSLTDLAKVFGMLIPKLQTESTLGSAIPVKVSLPEPEKKPVAIGELKNPKEIPTLGEAIKSSMPISEIRKPGSLSETTVGLRPLRLGEGTFNIPSGEPVNLKLPISEAKKPETVIQKTNEKRSGSPMKRLVQKIELGRMAKEEESSRANLYQGPTEISDVMSEVSTTPLYEGGREIPEPKVKRSYIKTGKYAGQSQKRKIKAGMKQFAEYQTD